jgi:hypothetical protein
MARFQHPLDSISVAAPCSANWDDMIGTHQARFCGQCSKNVYNLSGMTRREAENLIARSEGRLCVRYFRRADGTILTQNCPVGLAAARARVKKWATAVLATVISFFSGLGIFTAFGALLGTGNSGTGVGVMGTIAERPERPVVGEMIQGGMIYDRDYEEIVGKVQITPRKRARNR